MKDFWKDIDWDGSTAYTDAWGWAVKTWNDEDGDGAVDIATTTWPWVTDLSIYDQPDPNVWYAAYYQPGTNPDTIQINPSIMDGLDDNTKKTALTHELGHALGLAHSYIGNIMAYTTDPQEYLGDQDKLDYDYLWR